MFAVPRRRALRGDDGAGGQSSSNKALHKTEGKETQERGSLPGSDVEALSDPELDGGREGPLEHRVKRHPEHLHLDDVPNDGDHGKDHGDQEYRQRERGADCQQRIPLGRL